MKVELLKHTKGNSVSCDLYTFRVEVPLYIWTEILTHRTFARNASSARAMSSKRYVRMGNYVPDTFYSQGKGMQSSTIPVKHQWLARFIWNMFFVLSTFFVKVLEKLNVSKEQRNRLVPPTKIVAGIITGTGTAWDAFLKLRDSVEADTAMQELASQIRILKDNSQPVFSDVHNPFDSDLVTAIAKVARVSYNRESGKEDGSLVRSLAENGHMSPFEHFALFNWQATHNCYGSGIVTLRELIEANGYDQGMRRFKEDLEGWYK
jgi:thymidylate synthase ThyX